jgi:hypothetical protein
MAVTVKDLLNALSIYDRDMQVSVCGDCSGRVFLFTGCGQLVIDYLPSSGELPDDAEVTKLPGEVAK